MHDLAWDLVGCMFRMASSRGCVRESSIAARVRFIHSSTLSRWADKNTSVTASSTAGRKASELKFGRIACCGDILSVNLEIRASYRPPLLSSSCLITRPFFIFYRQSYHLLLTFSLRFTSPLPPSRPTHTTFPSNPSPSPTTPPAPSSFRTTSGLGVTRCIGRA